MEKIIKSHSSVKEGFVKRPSNITLCLWCVVFLYFCLILLLSLSYHWGFLSSLGDLGMYDQAVWGTLNGHPFLNSTSFNSPMNFLGHHFNAILAIFIPFYALIPRVEWMAILQSFALAISAWPIYLLGRKVLNSEATAFCIAVSFLINPFVLSVPPWVFHPESLAVPFFALALLGVERANFRIVLASCIVLMLCKEHFGIAVAGFGVLWWVRHRDPLKSLILIGSGLVASVLILFIIMPRLSPTGKHLMVGADTGPVMNRFGWLGTNLVEIVEKILFHPIDTIGAIISMGGIHYLMLLFLLFLGVPILGIEYLAPGIADFAANLLSGNPIQRSIVFYHSVCLIPIITVAAIYGLKRISQRTSLYSIKAMALFILYASLIGSYLYLPLPLPGAQNFWKPIKLFNSPDPKVAVIRQLIGCDASVSAQANVGAHFSERMKIYKFPNMVGDADVIILRLASPTLNISRNPDYPKDQQKYITGSLDAHLQMNRDEYIKSMEDILNSKDYGVLLWEDPWLVLSKNGQDNADRDTIRRKLIDLKGKWGIKKYVATDHNPASDFSIRNTVVDMLRSRNYSEIKFKSFATF